MLQFEEAWALTNPNWILQSKQLVDVFPTIALGTVVSQAPMLGQILILDCFMCFCQIGPIRRWTTTNWEMKTFVLKSKVWQSMQFKNKKNSNQAQTSLAKATE